MTRSGWFTVLLLLTAAALSGLLLWTLHRPEPPPALIGPPRTNYAVMDFQMTALGQDGRESFSVSGPRLASQPELGTYLVDNPRFVFPDPRGGNPGWTARADQAIAAPDTGELRLTGQVSVDGSDEHGGKLSFQTGSLSVFPEAQRTETSDVVTFISPHATLRGRGLQADLQTRRFQLLHEVTGHYDSPRSKPSH